MTLKTLWQTHVAWRLMPSSGYWRVALEWEKRQASVRRSHKKARANAREAGLCTQCCTVRPNKGHLMCSVCRARSAKAQKRQRLRRKAAKPHEGRPATLARGRGIPS